MIEIGLFFLTMFIFLFLTNYLFQKVKESHFQKVFKYINEHEPSFKRVTIRPSNWLTKTLKMTDGLNYRYALDESGKKYGIYQNYNLDKSVQARLFDISQFAKPKLLHIQYVAIPEEFFK